MLSIRRVVQTLRPFHQITVRIAGQEHLAAGPASATAQAILDALAVEVQ